MSLQVHETIETLSSRVAVTFLHDIVIKSLMHSVPKRDTASHKGTYRLPKGSLAKSADPDLHCLL